MKTAIADLVKRMMGGREDVPELCVRAIGVSDDNDETDGGNVCCRLSGDEAALLDGVPEIVSVVTAETDPDTVDTPFVRFGDLLYTRRNWRYEQIVRSRVTAMSCAPWLSDVTVPQREEYAMLRPEDQCPAIPTLLAHRFSILTGGPGTGKTFTLGKAVNLMRERMSDARIALAAPTGKAAARINESLVDLKKQGLLEGIQPATTLHTLLGTNPDFVSFKHDRSNPLPMDWLVVDEASMIGLPLMAKLLDALPPECALTLIGDSHQLASVDQGRVFGDLCDLFDHNVAKLMISKRFPSGGTIDRLASAVNSGRDGSFDAVMAVLREEKEASFRNISGKDPFAPAKWNDFQSAVRNGFGELSQCSEAVSALEKLNGFRVLCVLRKGPYGTESLNEYIKRLLGKKCPMPVMITRNDHSLEVQNGDVGVVMPDEPQYIYLPTLEKGVRKLRLELLNGTELAFATTIHKAQGSEFGNVSIVMPPEADLPLLTREILYTGITRTKGAIRIYAGEASIKACCEKSVERETGLKK